MKPEEVLAHPARKLAQKQREQFFQQGYLLMPELIDRAALVPLRAAMEKAVELSRDLTESTDQLDLENGHSAENPRLRRVAYVDDFDPKCWAFCSNSAITDIAADILGPNVRFQDALINFKWAGGGASVKWHQDIAFYPHTNVGTCQFLLALDDIGPEQGPLKIVPNSHKGPIFEHYDEQGEWTGALTEQDLASVGVDNAIEVIGGAGTVSVHHSCAVHGSAQNMSALSRPMMVLTYSSADAISYTPPHYPSSHHGQIVCGKMPRYAHHQELNMPLPPDWSGGYTSIFTHQEQQAQN